MKDRFKFRAWYDGRYIYKDLCDSNYYTEDGKCIGLANTLPNDLPWEQCTGLKDKNGKLIYEGDIIEHRIYLGNPELYVVKWSESVNGWVYQEAKNSLKTSYILTEFTDSIIGNIHENQELLKESK